MRVPAIPIAIALCIIAGACTSTTRLDTSAISFSQSPLIGKIVWTDLITDDLEAVRAFYGGLFGWTYDEAGRRDGHKYLIARAGNAYAAGILEVDPPPDGKPVSRWLPYISVADVGVAVERASANGGRVAVAPTRVGLGRVAAIIDPEGAVIGLARSRIGDPDEATTAPALGRIVWTELLANDPERAAEFYASVVGYVPLTTARRGGEYTWLTYDGTRRAGLFANPSSEADPVWLTSFAVADPVAAAERAQALGGTVVLPPSPTLRDNTIAVVTDPGGAILVLQKFPQ